MGKKDVSIGHVLVPARILLSRAAAALALMCVAFAAAQSAVAGSTFVPTGSMAAPHVYTAATLLSNGQVLIAGGRNNNGVIASAELYNPASGTFAPTGDLQLARYAATATLLPNGQVGVSAILCKRVMV